MSLERVHNLVWTLVETARTHQLSFLAAAIAYYAFVSFVPLTLLGVVVATAVGGGGVADAVLAGVGNYLSPSAGDLLRSTLAGREGRAEVTVLGFAVLAWSGSRVLRGLDVAFARIYRTEREATLPDRLRDAALVSVGIAVAVAGVVALAGAFLPKGPLTGVAGSLVAALVLTLVFLPLYYVFPDVSVSVRAAVPGAAVAAVGWTLLGTAFGLYATYARGHELYGVAGGVLLLVTWFYFAGYLLLLGAVVNVVLSADDRQAKESAARTGER